MASPKLHDDEVDIDTDLVRGLVDSQFPTWSGLPLRRFRSTGTVNAIYRLGDDRYLRLPRVRSWASDVEKELRWLPRLAPYLPVEVPEPLATGAPTDEYPLPWAVFRWLPGDPLDPAHAADDERLAEDLGGFVAALRVIDAAGAPRSSRDRPLSVRDPEARMALAELRTLPGTAEADIGTDTDSDTDTHSDTDTGTDSGIAIGTDTHSGIDIDSDADSGTETDNGADPDTDTGIDIDSDADSGIDIDAAAAAWEDALRTPGWDGRATWTHGDLLPPNLLVDTAGRLTAVLDWGNAGVGDPAVDVLPAWSVLGPPGRAAFRAALDVDDATWRRARGMALHQALLIIPYYRETNPAFAAMATRTVAQVVADNARDA